MPQCLACVYPKSSKGHLNTVTTNSDLVPCHKAMPLMTHFYLYFPAESCEMIQSETLSNPVFWNTKHLPESKILSIR